MADANQSHSLSERPKETQEGDAAAPSKNALKKAAKEKEKAEKAAKRREAEDQQKQQTAANDTSTNDYGDLPLTGSGHTGPFDPTPGVSGPNENATRTTLDDLSVSHPENVPLENEEAGGPRIIFRAVVENAREQSAKLTFLMLGHRLSTIQAVVAASDSLSRQMVKFAKNISPQSQVLVHASVKAPKELVKSATIKHLEVHVQRLFVIARAETPLPVQVEDCERALPEEAVEKEKSGKENESAVAGDAAASSAAGQYEKQAQKQKEEPDNRPLVALHTRLNNRTIDLRSKLNHSIFLVKDGIVALFSEFLRSKKFVGVQTPKLQGASSEGGSAVFKVQYFDKDAFLAQSPQLHKQMLIAAQFERVFEVGPIFRAENSNTNRHLCEFTGLDVEMAFEESYKEVLDLLEELMLFIFRGLAERYKKESELVRGVYNVQEFKLPAPGQKVPRLEFPEGVKMLREEGVEIGDLDDLSTSQEKLLGSLVLKKYGSDFYILDKYPLAVRPFYTMPAYGYTPSTTSSEEQSSAPSTTTAKEASQPPVDPTSTTAEQPPPPPYSNSYDFHARGVELLSGAQRIHDPALLSSRLKAHGIDPNGAGLKEYVDSFRYGCPPHGGAGLGLERVLCTWLGLPNVRLGGAFVRDPGRLSP
ncbi:MAG: hypothetical protein M1831_004489 [Alyxoria varia]|nr:MAG: hypothetical protein M1831_004489 [Alyxoria varia]